MFIRFKAVLQNFEVEDIEIVSPAADSYFLSKNLGKNFGPTIFCAINDIKGTSHMSKVDKTSGNCRSTIPRFLFVLPNLQPSHIIKCNCVYLKSTIKRRYSTFQTNSIGSYSQLNKKLILTIFRYEIYKSPNIGLFARANDKIIITPLGFAETKRNRLKEYLEVEKLVSASVAGTRLIGAMAVMNNNGILVPSIASHEEIQVLKETTGLNVESLKSKFTAIGNLIATNDNGAVISPLFGCELDQQIRDVLGVPVHSITVGGFIQTGSMIVATNTGAAVHPKSTEKEIEIISEALQVQVEPLTINGGVPFLSSGIIANSKSVIVGRLTSGPELIMLSRAFRT
jgi:translation initiation factor 6